MKTKVDEIGKFLAFEVKGKNAFSIFVNLSNKLLAFAGIHVARILTQ